MEKQKLMDFYHGKKVLVTGHTGFKGSWLVKILSMAGAEITGYALESPTDPALFELAGLDRIMDSNIGDIRDFKHLSSVFELTQPEIVLHLAAQPIVRRSYQEPRETYEINVMGTVNICECTRLSSSVRSFLNVTTDKVYKNNEWCWGYRETDALDGFDPYSNSKSCSELVTHSYINSFFGGNLENSKTAVSTARAGNVIGGGDFAEDRIIPDCVRAVKNHSPIIIRNAYSIRPYQHVLEPLFQYLNIAAEQYGDSTKAGYYNIGPDESDCVTTGRLVELFGQHFDDDFSSQINHDPNAPHEANYLKLDTSLTKSKFGWKPTWHIEKAIEETASWSKVWLQGGSEADINREMENEIKEYIAD